MAVEPLDTMPDAIDARMDETLRDVFGFDAFRPMQREIVRSILDGRDVFVLMPTGGGKSLCFQLPALLLEGLTIVVSPLIALMKDQVDGLEALGVPATYINSSLTLGETRRRLRGLEHGAYKLVYVAPERLMTESFLDLLDQRPPAFFAIDEAHCISEWGHDFRPEYRQLRALRRRFPQSVIGAFTATATRRVQADIRAQLGLNAARVFQGSFNRPNLFYDVRPKQDAYLQLLRYIQEHPDASGIVYCQTRAGVEELTERLVANGISAVAYHAGLSNEERKARQDAFINDDARIVVATIAFGMGIDKPDVRFVIHYELPRNLEGYYQESGRAGRDGEPAECILFYSYADAAKAQFFIDQKRSPIEREVAQAQLKRMVEWASEPVCRRKTLLAYFDETFDGQEGACCDVCRSPRARVDATIPAQMFLSCVKRTRERFGIAYIVDVLRGETNERILRFGHERLSTWGIGRDRPRAEWIHLAHELLRGGFLRQAGEEFPILQVTELGHEVLFNGRQVSIVERPQPRSRAKRRREQPPEETGAYDGRLFERLKGVRKRLADERGVPPYVICSDRSLREMAAVLPRSRDELLGIHGIGRHKADDFGFVFLEMIDQHLGGERRRITLPPPPTPAASPPRQAARITPSIRSTLELFREGMSIDEIATERGLATTTVEGQLETAILAGEVLDIDHIVAPERRAVIERAFDQFGAASLRAVRDQLGETFSYQEIRLARALWRVRRGDSPV